VKLRIEKNSFVKTWQMAERNTSTTSTLSVLSGIRCLADGNTTILQATDLKTSVTCRAAGVTVEEAGEVVFPIKVVGELFKKVPADSFVVDVQGGKASLVAEKSRYRFTTYPVEEFPKLPNSAAARLLFDTTVNDLARLLDEGTFSGSPNEEFPQYLGTALFQVGGGTVRVVSTDGRRLSLSTADVPTEEGDENRILLPLKGLNELKRVLGTMEDQAPLRVLVDDSQAYFQAEGVEFSVRRVDSSFPPYEKILTKNRTSWMTIDRMAFVSALERAEVVVRDFSRMVVLNLAPGGSLKISARAPEVGEAAEELEGDIDGESLRIAFNARYLLEGLKALHGSLAHLCFNGPNGQMSLSRPGEENFLYVLMPITLPEEEPAAGEDAL
jgi:DNA polymerase-3 subunit beta